MGGRDYLSPFAEANKAICEGANERQVLNLITKNVSETLEIAGCFIKIRSPEGEPLEQKSLDIGRSSYKVKLSQGKDLEFLSSYGLSENFLYSERQKAFNSIFNNIPKSTIFEQNLPRKPKDIPEEDLTLMLQESLKAYLMFPIEVDGENVAFMALFGQHEGVLSSDDVKFARAISSRGVSAFLRMRDMERLLHRHRLFLESFQDISRAVNSTLNINKVLELAVTKISNVLGTYGTQIRLLDPNTQKLKVAASHGLSESLKNLGPIKALRTQESEEVDKVVVIDDVSSDLRIQFKDALLAENVTKMLTIPMSFGKNYMGELTLLTTGDRSFSKEEVDFSCAISQQCACAIHKAQMYQRVKYEFQHLMEDFGYDGSS